MKKLILMVLFGLLSISCTTTQNAEFRSIGSMDHHQRVNAPVEFIR